MTKTRKIKIGRVVSLVGNKTAVVQITEQVRHPKYHKQFMRSKKFHAHIADLPVKVGQVVKIIESRPRSAAKRWRVIK